MVKNDGSNIQNQNDSPTVQKIITSKRQLLTNNTPKVVRTSNLQQLLNQGTQKFVINQSNAPNKIIISSSANSQVSNQDTTVVAPQQTIVQQNAASTQLVQSPQQIVVSQPQQKVAQEYVNPTNQQQQIIFHGQRFVLNPGQRIQVTQQPTQVVQQIVQQPQVVQQITQVNYGNTINTPNLSICALNCNEINSHRFRFVISTATTSPSCTANITTTANNHSTYTSIYKSSSVSATKSSSSGEYTTANSCWQFIGPNVSSRQSTSCYIGWRTTSDHQVC